MRNVLKPDDNLIRPDNGEKKIIVEAIKSLILSGEGNWKSKIVPPGTIVELPESQANYVIKTGKAKLARKKVTKPKDIKKMQKKFRAKKNKELKERVDRVRNENN